MNKPSFTRKFLTAALLSLVFLAACSGQGSPTPDATASALTNTPPTPTAEPSPTPQPPAVWRIAPETADADLVSQVDQVLAAQTGIVVSTFAQFTAPDSSTNLKTVIFVDSAEDVAGIAAGQPDVQFIAIGADLPAAGANLSVIDDQLAQRSFLLGYIATLVAPDFRSGALFMENDPDLALLEDTFLNGGRYLCGRCVPVYTPLVTFPETTTMPAGSDSAALQAAFDTFNQNRYQVLFVPAAAQQPDFLAYLANQNVVMLGLNTPPSDYLPYWVVTIQADIATPLATLLPQALSGQGGQSAQASLALQDVNDAYLTSGKLLMVNETIQNIEGGWVTPQSVQP